MEGIIYSGWLAEDSKHSLDRAKERAGLNKKRAIKMMELARNRGITSADCTWSLDRSFLEQHSNEQALAVAFNGYCFILERATMNCITMFPLPRRFGQKKTFYKEKAKRTIYYYENAVC